MGIDDNTLTDLDEDSSNLLSSLPFLKHLSVSGNNLSIHGLHWLAKGMIKTENLLLKSLSLNQTQVNSKGIKLLSQGISNLKNLKSLDLSQNDIDDSAVDSLLALINPYSKSRVKIIKLDLSQNRLTGSGCSKLLTCFKNKQSKISKKNVKGKTDKKPKKCSLKELDISGNIIDASIINSLRHTLLATSDLSNKRVDKCIQKCLNFSKEH